MAASRRELLTINTIKPGLQFRLTITLTLSLALLAAGINQPATLLLEDGYDIRTIQELLGHAEMRTTRI